MSTDRVAVIMAGGSGERFWPLSRRAMPKQFLRLDPEGPRLIEMALNRLAPVVAPDRTYIATGTALGGATREICGGIPPENVLMEPEKKNTAGAVGWAMAHLPENAVVGFFPADHAISDQEGFARTVQLAFQIAEESDALVTIGIRPTRPETGFGYMEADSDGMVRRFHEKPDPASAEEYLRRGGFFWNAGMFFWSALAFWRELEAASPDYARILREIADTPHEDLPRKEVLFAMLPSISIDHLLMEKAESVRVVSAEFDWDDVGSLDALARWLKEDDSGNAFSGPGFALESHRNLVVTEGQGMVCLLGVDDLVVIQTADSTLICPRSRVQEVRLIVQAMERVDPDRL